MRESPRAMDGAVLPAVCEDRGVEVPEVCRVFAPCNQYIGSSSCCNSSPKTSLRFLSDAARASSVNLSKNS